MRATSVAIRPSTSPSASTTCHARSISLALGVYVGIPGDNSPKCEAGKVIGAPAPSRWSDRVSRSPRVSADGRAGDAGGVDRADRFGGDVEGPRGDVDVEVRLVEVPGDDGRDA